MSNRNRILIVDDNPDIHRDYIKILQPEEKENDLEAIVAFLGEENSPQIEEAPKLDLVSAYSGKEALEKITAARDEQDPFTMAFVDMRMPPGWDGLQTTEALWKVDPELQIVICTAYSDNSWSDVVQRVGRTDKLLILKKPFDAIEVAQLATALTEKWELSRQAQLRRDDLERLVEERTRQLQHAALHDPLTDLPNRRLFHMRLAEAINDQKSTEAVSAVILLDLDRFKQVNDSMGHPVGDELLKAVAKRLQDSAGPNDTMARFGGDEFAMIRRGPTSAAKLQEDAIKIEKRLCEPYTLSCATVPCPASMGMAIIPDHGLHPEELIRHADLALYQAKRDGRGDLRMFDATIDSDVVQSRQLETELARAIEEDQLELYYQPIIESKTGKVTTVEALVRWQHPDRGLVSPADFIPVAEECGLIKQLGEWVCRAASAEAVKWPDHIRLAVNVSAVQFRRKHDLFDSMVDIISRSGLPPHRLEIEITESALLVDSDETLDVLYLFRELGVMIAMDDFGIGYSSLNYLLSFPFDRLKLDRAFIGRLSECEDARAIVNAVAELGRNLGIETTAEGVETEDHRAAVVAAGFNHWQGFLHGRPRPANEMDSVFKNLQTQAILAD